MAVLRWNRVWILESSGTETEIFPPGHQGPEIMGCSRKKMSFKIQVHRWYAPPDEIFKYQQSVVRTACWGMSVRSIGGKHRLMKYSSTSNRYMICKIESL
ncbi:hypothetical protein AVEN_102694-1 [Araneus ventricosus]|uniref:Uncharacterized protein n=1 Tax=Araneus ventricosus TaxID=182803 RepID=A0A4Y2SJS2_ARAVE|nr:hypothetical protein AVEN_102694-1 [Araneus ventricosus]